MRPAFIGVDWGTSNLRAWALDGDGAILAAAESAQGIGALAGDGFAQVLRALVGGWTDGHLPIVLGGMIGSRQGWHEAAYLPCPARVDGLAAAALGFDTGIGRGWIVPGLSCRDAAGIHDVMRGEEVQICGLDLADGLVVLPGTHSKWASIENGQVVCFKTFMTGELFALLKTHSILGRLMVAGAGDDDAFDRGVARAAADPALAGLLFSVRTEALFEALPPRALADYLSGLLIGAEIRCALDAHGGPLALIGDPALCDSYVGALALFGVTHAKVLTGVTEIGLWQIARCANLVSASEEDTH